MATHDGQLAALDATGRVIAPDANETRRAPALRVATPTRDDRSADVEAATAGLIFEMANVFYDATLWWRWFATLLARLRTSLDSEALAETWTSRYLPEIRRGRREFGEALDTLLHACGFSRGEIDELLVASLSRRRDLEFNVMPFPGVKKTLSRLKRTGLRLAVVSDSTNSTDELWERLTRLGLGDLIDAVVSSVELGTTKPEPANYLAAVKQVGAPREQLWFVGQSASDLAGAQAAGLRTASFNCIGAPAADRHLDRFGSLLELVKPAPSGCGEKRIAS